MAARKSKTEKAMETLLAMMSDSGVDTSELDLTIPRHNYRSSDAVVVFVNQPSHFKPGVCKECGRTFAVNKKSVGYCSDPCRDENFRRTTGLSPNVVKIHDVWDGDPPMIVTPDQFDKLRAIADWFTQMRTSLQVEKKEEEYPEGSEDIQDIQDHQVESLQPQESEYFVESDVPQTNPASSPSPLETSQTSLEVATFEFL